MVDVIATILVLGGVGAVIYGAYAIHKTFQRSNSSDKGVGGGSLSTDESKPDHK